MDADDRIQQISERVEKASFWDGETQREIRIDPEDGYVYAPQGATLGDTLIQLADTYDGSGHDWNFVAHARSDIPFLLEQLALSEQRCQTLNEHLTLLQQGQQKDKETGVKERDELQQENAELRQRLERASDLLWELLQLAMHRGILTRSHQARIETFFDGTSHAALAGKEPK